MQYLPKLKVADIVYLCGASGCGKGYTAKALTAADSRLVVFDTPSDWDTPRTVKIDADMRKLVDMMKRPSFRVAFRPDLDMIDVQINQFCRIAYAIGRCRVVFDEMGEYSGSNWLPSGMRNIVSRSRHRGLHVIGMHTRPAEHGKSIITNATEIYAGRLAEESDIRPLRSRAGREFTDRLPLLPKRGLIHWKA